MAVKPLGLRGGPAAGSTGRNLQNTHPGMEGNGQNVAGANGVAGLQHLHAVEADVTALNQSCRQHPGLHNAGEAEPFIEALAGVGQWSTSGFGDHPGLEGTQRCKG